eukprot:4212189-Pyramimonas_sp.AAC.1
MSATLLVKLRLPPHVPSKLPLPTSHFPPLFAQLRLLPVERQKQACESETHVSTSSVRGALKGSSGVNSRHIMAP